MLRPHEPDVIAHYLMQLCVNRKSISLTILTFFGSLVIFFFLFSIFTLPSTQCPVTFPNFSCPFLALMIITMSPVLAMMTTLLLSSRSDICSICRSLSHSRQLGFMWLVFVTMCPLDPGHSASDPWSSLIVL